MPAGGTEALLVPKDIPEQEEDGAPPDAPGSVQSTPVPEQKPGAACSTQPAAPSAAPKGSTAKAEQAQVSSAAGSRSRTPSSAPSQNTYEYRVAASKVQKGMNTVNTLVRLEAADGKQVDAFAPGRASRPDCGNAADWRASVRPPAGHRCVLCAGGLPDRNSPPGGVGICDKYLRKFWKGDAL